MDVGIIVEKGHQIGGEKVIKERFDLITPGDYRMEVEAKAISNTHCRH